MSVTLSGFDFGSGHQQEHRNINMHNIWTECCPPPPPPTEPLYSQLITYSFNDNIWLLDGNLWTLNRSRRVDVSLCVDGNSQLYIKQNPFVLPDMYPPAAVLPLSVPLWPVRRQNHASWTSQVSSTLCCRETGGQTEGWETTGVYHLIQRKLVVRVDRCCFCWSEPG